MPRAGEHPTPAAGGAWVGVRASFERGGGGGGEGGRGFWTQNLVYQKWPDTIFPFVNFVFSRDGHFGLGRGGGGFGGGVPPPLVFNYSKEALGGGCGEGGGRRTIHGHSLPAHHPRPRDALEGGWGTPAVGHRCVCISATQKCKAKVEEKRSSVTRHRRLSRKKWTLRKVTPPPFQGAQPMPSHRPPDAQCQPHWRL